MKTILTLMIGIFCILTILPNFVNAEVSLWNNVILDTNNSIVKHHLFYQLTDTFQQVEGQTGIFAIADLVKSHRNKVVLVGLYYDVNAIPYNLTYGSVDYCNLSIKQFHNVYDSSGELTGSNYTSDSLLFGTGVATAGSFLVNMKADDTITADMSCHYTDTRSLFEDNILVGKITTFIPSFSCADCEQYSFEELSNEVDRTDEIIAEQNAMWTNIQNVIDFNFTGWLILSWLIKIAIIFIAVGLLLTTIYYIYNFVKSIEEEI
jgi:hypothetical protein